MVMFEAIAIFLVGFIPGSLSCVIMRKVQIRMRQRTYTAMVSPGRRYRPHPYLEAMDYCYVEGLGYMLGDITCQFNARSPYLRCTVNPSGPCKECPHYESIQLD
ncbi:DUF6464 family protein [Leptolyngbyaceae cyanobacterium UHCC 1019]